MFFFNISEDKIKAGTVYIFAYLYPPVTVNRSVKTFSNRNGLGHPVFLVVLLIDPTEMLQ